MKIGDYCLYHGNRLLPVITPNGAMPLHSYWYMLRIYPFSPVIMSKSHHQL